MEFKMMPGGEVARDKWNRMNNPKALEDYGLSLSEAEMRMFPQGREVLCDVVRYARNKNKMGKLVKAMVEMAEMRLNERICKCLTESMSH